jgi:hypothetical protein
MIDDRRSMLERLPLMAAGSTSFMTKFVVGLVALSVSEFGCSQTPPPAHPAATPVSSAIEVPLQPQAAGLPRQRVASGLLNPRGMHRLADGSLLVSLAGSGDPENLRSGGLARLHDDNHDGDFDDAGERTTLLADQPSHNILEIVRRDEVFGMAGIAEGAGEVLVALADFGGPSTIFRVHGDAVEPWGSTRGNVNDLTYDERRHAWMAVASSTDEVLQLIPGGRSERVVKIPPLASGQDAVPAYLQYDPQSGDVLVSLFSGSPEGEEGGQGVEIVPRSASIVRVLPETHRVEPVVVGLTVPTDLDIAEDGSIYVLEFCDSFLEPVTSRQAMLTSAIHGGFRRFSGRLLRVDRKQQQVTVVATGLDAPTNLTRVGKALYVAEGMGTPGRLIPGPEGKPVELTGFIERIDLP